jgi:hypothetical protein
LRRIVEEKTHLVEHVVHQLLEERHGDQVLFALLSLPATRAPPVKAQTERGAHPSILKGRFWCCVVFFLVWCRRRARLLV